MNLDGAARRPTVLRVLLAAAIALLDDAAYVVLISGYGPDGRGSRTLFIVAFVLVVSGLALVGAAMTALDHRAAGPLLWTAGTGYAGLGLLGIASIGLPLLLAAGLTCWSALRWPATRMTVVAAALPLVLLAAGFALT
jgi:hypothetical protein